MLISKFISFIVVVIILFGAGWASWEFMKSDEEILHTYNNQAVVEQTNQAIKRAVEAENYQLRVFYGDGFSFVYPRSWEAGSEGVRNPSTNSTFSVTKNDNPKKLTLDEWFHEATTVNERPTAKANAEVVTINGIKAYRLESQLPPPGLYFEVVGIADKKKTFFQSLQTTQQQKTLRCWMKSSQGLILSRCPQV